jgi:hypothetical protein
LAMACSAPSTTSLPRATRAMMKSLKIGFLNYGIIE